MLKAYYNEMDGDHLVAEICWSELARREALYRSVREVVDAPDEIIGLA